VPAPTDIRAALEILRERIDIEEPISVGTVTATMIRRYARAIGDNNPLYFDRAVARRAGYSDILAPPNLLASLVDWTHGPLRCELRIDGSAIQHALSGIPQAGFRHMGVGENAIFHQPVVAETVLVTSTVLKSIEIRRSPKNHMAILVLERAFRTADGNPVVTCQTRLLMRPEAASRQGVMSDAPPRGATDRISKKGRCNGRS
jgi:acyl dehydratase